MTPRTVTVLATVLLAALAASPVPTSLPAAGPTTQNDAGTHQDAGERLEWSIPIELGETYDATLVPEPLREGYYGDVDWFSFEATAGDVITAAMLARSNVRTPVCVELRDDFGLLLASDCVSVNSDALPEPITALIPEDGTYVAAFGHDVSEATDYRFTVGYGDLATHPLVARYATAGHDMVPDPDAPTVVVAVADSGVNPYHEAYRRPNLTVHPCQWVAGFDDCSVPALELSIGEHDSYEEAFEADRAVWAGVEVGRWYWIPGTNIIGAVCDGSSNAYGNPPPVTPDTPCILDEGGHGTGTTSSVLAEAPNALLLVHEGSSAASALEHAPVVPDIQSHSWGPPAPLPLHAADPVTQPMLGLADPGAVDPATLFFIAAGNEAPFPTLLDLGRVHPSVQVVGGGFPGQMTTSSWSLFDYASWFCRPVAAADSTDAVDPSRCGTSFSAPTVAGTAAAALLELRRREGYTGRSTADMVTPRVGRDGFVAALRAGAAYQVDGQYDTTGRTGTTHDMPPGTEHHFWGYGWLDGTRVDAVVACAALGDCPAKSAEAERWNELRRELRRRQTEPLLP